MKRNWRAHERSKAFVSKGSKSQEDFAQWETIPTTSQIAFNNKSQRVRDLYHLGVSQNWPIKINNLHFKTGHHLTLLKAVFKLKTSSLEVCKNLEKKHFRTLQILQERVQGTQWTG